MAGPGLPTNVTAVTTGHPTHSNTVHGVVNEFDTGIGSASDGQVLTFSSASGVYIPATPAAGPLTIDDLPAGVGVVVLTTAGSRPTSDASRIVIAVGGSTPPAWGLTNDVHIATA